MPCANKVYFWHKHRSGKCHNMFPMLKTGHKDRSK